MSKMPAKKKSCFEITSVTTAQAASSIAEDAESLDGDPEESRTEDVSSEIFDVSRATDGRGCAPEEDEAAGRSSSEESNVGSRGTTSLNPLQAPAPPAGSRFRVIKLDQGTGEPYRRGRWTCLEFYDREADSIRHGPPAAEQGADRDSGLGGSHAGPFSEPQADSSCALSHILQMERAAQSPPQQQFLVGQQLMGGAAPQQVLYGAPQGLGPGHPQGSSPAVHNGKVTAGQAAQYAYTQAHTDYMQSVSVLHPQGAPSNVPSSFLPLGQVTGRNHVGSDHGQGAAPAHPAGIPQAGGVMSPAGLVPQKSVTQQHPLAGISPGVTMPPGAPLTVNAAVQNVTAAGVPVVPSSASTTPITMPNVPVTVVHSHQSSHATVTRSTSLVQQPVGLPVMQGNPQVHSNLPQLNHGPFQTPPFAHADDRRKSEPLPPLSLIAEHKPFMGPMADTLTNPLHLPVTTPMNAIASSVFGIAVPVDGDEDSASSASVVAIDNKIEQAMDLVKSHLMYAVREEVEVLKEQIKELIEKNSTLERENALLKSLTNNDHLAQLSNQAANFSSTLQQKTVIAQTLQAPQQPNVTSS